MNHTEEINILFDSKCIFLSLLLNKAYKINLIINQADSFKYIKFILLNTYIEDYMP